MTEDVLSCPLCGGKDNRLFDRCKFHGREVVNRICLKCGLVFQSPRMTEKEAQVFYATEYRLLQEGSIDPTPRNIGAQARRARALVDFTRSDHPSVIRHLDIGSSMGILLQHFKDQYHCQAVGVEPGEAHRSRAASEGLKVYPSLDELEKAREASFDLVSMSHVLEHLPDPVSYLIHLRESILTPHGLLLLEVPNLFAHDSFEVAHLFAFSPHTFQEVLRRSGFVVVKFEQHGRPNSQILPLFLTALCRPADQPAPATVQPEQYVLLKRRAGMIRRRVLQRLFPKRAWLPVRREVA
jgi:SAM-dependent methyltransferase